MMMSFAMKMSFAHMQIDKWGEFEQRFPENCDNRADIASGCPNLPVIIVGSAVQIPISKYITEVEYKDIST